jgi:hypothetical protein
MGKDKRSSPRISASFKVEMSHPELGTVLTKTRDISDRGAFVFTEQDASPDIKERVQLKVLGLPGEPASPVESEVVRVEYEGVGLKFVLEERNDDEDDEEFLNS